MRDVFADAGYWIAMINPGDGLNQQARQAFESLGNCRIVTTEMVLVEVLNHFASHGAYLRKAAVDAVKRLKSNPNVEVVSQTMCAV